MVESSRSYAHVENCTTGQGVHRPFPQVVSVFQGLQHQGEGPSVQVEVDSTPFESLPRP